MKTTYSKARIEKDRNFDGLFFFAVKSTGIFCRPDLNIEYHESFIPGSEIVNRALNLIYNGFLNYHSIDELASEIYTSPRQLRKLFIDCIGIPPVKIGRYHKAVFARKLLPRNGGRTAAMPRSACGIFPQKTK